ncbi:substrate-binding domain-containing protein [Corynebacterium breve]|uniref:Substrate-binding domain-containing protein n=1 Tax=Corynebacterium breve TaxID=3049799 RepID=A0ABY8VGG5_9CORY|nr:substrate-binding domain-containing protein [Corynebacterium breve]WIM68739.1 substrate-binding domain-containing protein [Corynebacterium breve]
MPFAFRKTAISALLATSLVLTGCAQNSEDDDAIRITGSATVEPITRLAATEHKAKINMTADGTYDGFEAFCAGNSDINNASSAITEEYIEACEKNGVEFVELPIGIDALSMVANRANSEVDDLSTEELKKIWEPDSQVKTWADVREGLPDEEIRLVGRPEGSGTFSYFTAMVNGEADAVRKDYEKTDSITELTGWVSESEYALGFMGVGNYLASDEDHRNEMNTLTVDGVEPSLGNAQDGSYPFTRPLFIYVSVDALEKKDGVEEFVTDYVENSTSIVPRVFFYGLTEDAQEAVVKRLEDRETGSLFDGDPFQELDVNEELTK